MLSSHKNIVIHFAVSRHYLLFCLCVCVCLALYASYFYTLISQLKVTFLSSSLQRCHMIKIQTSSFQEVKRSIQLHISYKCYPKQC